jgi:hypothetical protein
MTQCCDDAGRCTGQKDCAIRTASSQPIRGQTVRRYRAGQPAAVPMPDLPADLPIDVAKPDPAPPPQEPGLEGKVGWWSLLLLTFFLIGAWLGYLMGGM